MCPVQLPKKNSSNSPIIWSLQYVPAIALLKYASVSSSAAHTLTSPHGPSCRAEAQTEFLWAKLRYWDRAIC